jgi:hypothetical protein
MLADVVYICEEGLVRDDDEDSIPLVFRNIWSQLAAGVHVHGVSHGEDIKDAVFFDCD